jgi:hypothetical protein
MNTTFDAPSIPEETDRDEASKEDTSRQTHFRLKDAIISFGHADDCNIGDAGDDDETGEES